MDGIRGLRIRSYWIQQADILLVIDEGLIVEQARHAELKEKRGLYCEMVMRQMTSSQFESWVKVGLFVG